VVPILPQWPLLVNVYALGIAPKQGASIGVATHVGCRTVIYNQLIYELTDFRREPASSELRPLDRITLFVAGDADLVNDTLGICCVNLLKIPLAQQSEWASVATKGNAKPEGNLLFC